jgi:hypothetical protein
VHGLSGALHGGIVAGLLAGGLDLLRRVVAVGGGELLPDLHAAAVAVHVAEAAQVHEDIEAEALPGGEGAQQFVVLAAMPGA